MQHLFHLEHLGTCPVSDRCPIWGSSVSTVASIKAEERKKGTVYVARVRTPGKGTLTQTFTKWSDADQWAKGIEGDKARAKLPANVRAGKTKFAKYAATWIEDRDLRFRTIEGYNDLLERFILPTFKNHQLNQIDGESVRAWRTKLLKADTKAGRSHNQTAKAYALLRAILNTAVSDGAIGQNPCQIRGAGTIRTEPRPFAEPADVFALANAIDGRFRCMVLLAGFLGLRRGELLGLRRRDVDPLHGEIVVERQVVRTGKNRIEGDPKSAAGHRKRPLPPFLAEELSVHMTLYTDADPDDPLFVGYRGEHLSAITWQRAYKKAKDATGLTVTLHDLRHSAATMFAWSGATTAEIMSHLGHSTPAAAMKYQHAAQSRDEETAAWLEAIATKAKANPRKTPTPIGATKLRQKRAK